MKKSILITALLGTAALSASAELVHFTYDSGFADSGNIPDGNTSPWSDTRTLSGMDDCTITGVQVRLELSGSYNGDLYGYLSYNGVLVPLMNRVGVGSGNAFGYGDAGLSVTFSDTAPANIHFYQAVSDYSITGGALWQPDGRTVSPIASSPFDFDAPGTVTLGRYDDMAPNGDWSLIFADVSVGGGQATVVQWGLDIQVVPEPTGMALGMLGGALCWLLRRR